jgi:hypothetical protein
VFQRLKVKDSICITSFDGKRILAIVHWPAELGDAAALRSYFAEGNQKLAEHERVKLFVHSDTPFTVMNGMLTGTHKLRRHQIRSTFCNATSERVEN